MLVKSKLNLLRELQLGFLLELMYLKLKSGTIKVGVKYIFSTVIFHSTFFHYLRQKFDAHTSLRNIFRATFANRVVYSQNLGDTNA